MTNYIFYPIYSIIQGITEFIPISSSGHLNILEIIVNNENSRNLLYETTAHMASLLALLLYLLKNDHFSNANIKLNFIPITLATIPAIIVGLTLITLQYDFVNIKLIGITSIVGAILLYISDIKIFHKMKIESLQLRFIIAGLFQCLAYLPGFSRSGSCIIAFRLLGETRKSSSVKSLYLGIPIILLSFISNLRNLESISLDYNLLIIFFVTFITAYLTLIFFINFINKIGFKPFVIYRIILGVLILVLF
ncbi:MAG: undecaprenyl-diphosphate phosphatase [Alphaproteobacteria bacterium]|nr:undecaprenyl-diphosphate phosphatase [Alphaproteobacteria bacterium]